MITTLFSPPALPPAPKLPREKVRVTLTLEGSGPDAQHRLKMFLKFAFRSYRLRCTSIADAPADLAPGLRTAPHGQNDGRIDISEM